MINKIYIIIRKIIKLIRYQLIFTIIFSCVYATIYKYNNEAFIWAPGSDSPNFLDFIYFSFQIQSTIGESGSLAITNWAKIAVCLQSITTMAGVLDAIKSIDRDIIKKHGKKKKYKL